MGILAFIGLLALLGAFSEKEESDSILTSIEGKKLPR